jgi:hypothetical protein
MTTTTTEHIKKYCDTMYDDLQDMKSRLYELIDHINSMEPRDQYEKVVKTHAPHLKDIADTIDWKLQILVKACPTDWEKIPETDVSVREPEQSEKDTAALGNLGG